MQKETKEILCTSCISFLSGVLITLIIFGCATHMARWPDKKMHSCPYAQQIQSQNKFKHHNKLMGREMPPPVETKTTPQ